MAKNAELARCNDGLTGERAISRIARDTCIEFGATLDGWNARVRHNWPWLCGAELLIKRFRTECFQLDEPEIWHTGCPAVGVGGLHSDEYSEDGEFLCQWCGARPAWPGYSCRFWSRNALVLARWPHLCTGWEVFATATYDGKATIGLCWVPGARAMIRETLVRCWYWGDCPPAFAPRWPHLCLTWAEDWVVFRHTSAALERFGAECGQPSDVEREP